MAAMLAAGWRRQTGQAVVLIAFMLVVLIGAIGLAVDGGVGYYYNNLAERAAGAAALSGVVFMPGDRKSTRLNSSHSQISYAVFCLKKKKNYITHSHHDDN